jgi:hypothetical protein
MMTDIFGDLREWNRVLKQLEQLQDTGQLDDHQDGLARLLRYRFNWRLREKAVQSLSALSEPEDRILLLVLEIGCDENTGFDLRTLAADSLCGLISMRQKRGQCRGELKRRVIERLSATMNPYHPVEFQRAAKQVIDRAQQNVRAAVAV